MAALFSLGEIKHSIAKSGRMDQATIALLSTQATQAKLQHCELDYQFGCESKSCVAAGDILEKLVAVIEKSSDQSSAAECMV